MRINHNLASLNTYNKLTTNTALGSKSLEKLSSGLRINKAGDDAAGLAISEKMRGKIRGLDQATRNAQDGISMIQTAEGALNETHSILQRMRELAVQGSNETLQTGDREAIGEELLALKNEINRISDTTKFNGKALLNGDLSTTASAASTLLTGIGVGTAVVSDLDVTDAIGGGSTYTFTATTNAVTLTRDGATTQTLTIASMTAGSEQTFNFDQLGISVKLVSSAAEYASSIGTGFNGKKIETVAANNSANFAIGADANQNMAVSFSDMGADQIGGTVSVASAITSNAAVANSSDAQSLITILDDAITDVSSQRGKLGAAQNRLEHTINNLSTSQENLTASESRIRDVDMAKEMMEYTKTNILTQAAQAMLAQANQGPQGVLQLLR
jgi:flagellin